MVKNLQALRRRLRIFIGYCHKAKGMMKKSCLFSCAIKTLIANPLFGMVAILLTALGALSFALIAEHSFGVRPCVLCYYQRYIFIALIVSASTAVTFFTRPYLLQFAKAITTVLVLSGLGLSVYHVGVEQHWWKGPDSCSANSPGSSALKSIDEELAALQAAMKNSSNLLVRCDDVNWKIFSISATIWTTLLYLFLTFLSISGWIQKKKSV